MAMTDISDNMNKMGSNMEDIKNAYQGFAKQNYTMLDNLKLGYGGTKTEMERLLADAEKITGVKYDINNLSDDSCNTRRAWNYRNNGERSGNNTVGVFGIHESGV